MSILIERTGLFDTLQDAGRTGFRSFGVPTGGWFDAFHAQLANALAGNDRAAPCLEITQASGLFRTESTLDLAVVGPGSRTIIHRSTGQSRTFKNSVAVRLNQGDRLEIQHPVIGLRSYVAVAYGGWRSDAVLGSVSSEKRLVQGDRLTTWSEDVSLTKTKFQFTRYLDDRLFLANESTTTLRFLPFEAIFDELKNMCESLSNLKALAQSNRIGVRLEPSVKMPESSAFSMDANRLSQPVLPGTIQWTGSQWIILGVASGTMGGYPSIGQMIGPDLQKLAQIRPGTSVNLEPVTIEEARKIKEMKQSELSQLFSMTRNA